jgi:hypothetical protein
MRALLELEVPESIDCISYLTVIIIHPWPFSNPRGYIFIRVIEGMVCYQKESGMVQGQGTGCELFSQR